MRYLVLYFLVVSSTAMASDDILLPDDEWTPLNLEQAESVCAFKEVKRPSMGHKYKDGNKKKYKQCLEKTQQYGSVGKGFTGFMGSSREDKAVRARQLELQQQAAPAPQHPVTVLPETPDTVEDLVKRLNELEERIRALELKQSMP